MSNRSTLLSAGPTLALGLALLCSGLMGCTGRDRDNPFDPGNPSTGGEPPGLRAVASCGQVDLTWTDQQIVDLKAIHVWRGEGPWGDALGERLTTTPLDAATMSFTDTLVENAILYNYTVEFLFTGEDHAYLAPAEAEPGTGVPWVGDPCGWGLARLSPDGRRMLERVLTSALITDAQVDPTEHLLYAAQIDRDRIVVLDSRSGLYLREYPVSGATGLDWNRADNLLAVTSYYERQVAWITLDGTQSATLTASSYPEAVALRDSSLTWIAFEDGSVLQHDLRSETTRDPGAGLLRAVALADDADGGGCWVADRDGGRVVYIGDDGAIERSAEGLVREPLDLRASGTGTCWAADYAGGKLIELDRACQEIDRRENVGRVAEVVFDSSTGALWATVPDEGLVIRILPDGSRVTLELAGCPRRLAGDWLGGCL